MPTPTVLLILLSGIIALLWAMFQYLYKTKRKRVHWILAVLRFISVGALGILIINPKFEKLATQLLKPKLSILVDNSQSIKFLNKDSLSLKLSEILLNDQRITERFEVSRMGFDAKLISRDSLTFEGSPTNITKALQEVETLNRSQSAPIVLISDGQHTYGQNYAMVSKQFDQAIFPLILGHTDHPKDLRIETINTNRYSYFKNQFPVELFLSYDGVKPVRSRLQIKTRSATIYEEILDFSETQNSRVVTPILNADKVGIQQYEAHLLPIEGESTTKNNSQQFSIEVIDQQTRIALISNLTHPDIGTLKTAIETNKQRRIDVMKPSKFLEAFDDYNSVILYQPDISFKQVFERIAVARLSYFLICGPQTDFKALNQYQSHIKQQNTGLIESYEAEINPNYNVFNVAMTFSKLPPMDSAFGTLETTVGVEPMLFKTIDGITTKDPLLFSFEAHQQRGVVLMGEGLWKWRMHFFRVEGGFEGFDRFINQLVQYLSLNNRKQRLVVQHETLYDGSQPLIIKAQYFDQTYNLDPTASLEIELQHLETQDQQTFPMRYSKGNYKIDLSFLNPGSYRYKVSNSEERLQTSGQFQRLDYNIEHQYTYANTSDLQQLAKTTNGQVFNDNQIEQLINHLIVDNRFKSTQKVDKKSLSLIDFKFWLLLLVTSLTAEWLIRKYNGLI